MPSSDGDLSGLSMQLTKMMTMKQDTTASVIILPYVTHDSICFACLALPLMFNPYRHADLKYELSLQKLKVKHFDL